MKPVWLVAAVALAAFLWWRRRRLEPPVLIAGVIAVVAAAVYSTGLVELPSIDKVLEDIGRALGKWTYLLVAILAFLEAGAFVGLLIPGETAIIVAGVVAGQGEIDIVLLIAIAWFFAVAGDITGYMLGRRLGRPFLVKHGPRFGISEERIHQVDAFFAKHGGKAIFVGRFVGLVRSLAPFLAGLLGDAAAPVRPLRRARGRDPVDGAVPRRLLLLALAGPRAGDRQAGRAGAERDDRRARRDRRRRPLAAPGREPAAHLRVGRRARGEPGDPAAAGGRAPRASSRDVRVGPADARQPRPRAHDAAGDRPRRRLRLLRLHARARRRRADAGGLARRDVVGRADRRRARQPRVRCRAARVAARRRGRGRPRRGRPVRGPPAPGVPRAHRWAGADRHRRRDRRRGARPPGARRRRRRRPTPTSTPRTPRRGSPSRSRCATPPGRSPGRRRP